ncbi:collagen-like protein [Streptomyces sp. NPDC096198]|uniref:collagen-like triple helix repeat-containing protein n=1 Tax=Streptomyces sp. NPDC096198 TaxID=3366080 RepID=UPI00381EAEE0
MLPENIPTVTVRGRYLSPDGTPLSGSIVFRAPAQVAFPQSDVILGGPVTVQLDAQGAIEVTLPATDAPDMDPSGWAYAVTEQLAGIPAGRSYAVLLPRARTEVQLADIAPTDPSKPNYVPVTGPEGPRGPTGASAYEVAVATGFTGTPAAWLASLVGPRGATGAPGAQGIQGVPGKDGAPGTPGLVQSVNGKSAAAITLTAADVGALATSAAGAVGGVATLGADGKVPAAQLPTGSGGGGAVASVNGKTGTVVLTSADVGALDLAAADARYVQPSAVPVQSVAGKTGAVVLAAADVGAEAAGTAVLLTGTQTISGAKTFSSVPSTSAAPTSPNHLARRGYVDGLVGGEWLPSDHGLLTWAFDPALGQSTGLYPGSGSIRVTAVILRAPATVNRIVWFATGYAGGLTTGSWAALYDSTGARVAATGDMSTATYEPAEVHNTGGATISSPLTAAYSAPAGVFYVAWRLQYNTTTGDGPMLLASESGAGAPPNFFGYTAVRRFGVYSTGAASAPASIALASMENGANRFWAALA